MDALDEGQTILLDICDVSVALHDATTQELGIDLTGREITQWDIFNVLTLDECSRVLKLWDDPEFWRALPPVSGVHEGVDALRLQGFNIHWVTSPWHTCENWEGIRRTWMHEQGLVRDIVHDITVTTRKHAQDGFMFVDDRPKHVRLWGTQHPDRRSCIFDTPFNRWLKWHDRVTWGPSGLESIA